MIEKKSLDLLKTLIGFYTTSFKSNLDLIKFIENYLNQYKIKSELVYDETKNKTKNKKILKIIKFFLSLKNFSIKILILFFFMLKTLISSN